MRKNYVKPVMHAVAIQSTSVICDSSGRVQSVSGNASLRFGGAGDDDARAKSRGHEEVDVINIW